MAGKYIGVKALHLSIPAHKASKTGQWSLCVVGRKPRKISHAIHVEVIRFMIRLILGLWWFVAIENVPNKESQIDGEDHKPCGEHRNAHDCVILRCRMAMEKRRIVPAQCAEYNASSVWPNMPKPTE